MERLAYLLGRAIRTTPGITWIGWGIGIGAVFGLFFGGIGIAARGGAFGVSGWAVFAIVGGVIANSLFKRRIRRRALAEARATAGLAGK